MVTGGGPWSITFDSYNNNLYVANGDSNTVSTHTDPYGVCIFSNKTTTEINLSKLATYTKLVFGLTASTNGALPTITLPTTLFVLPSITGFLNVDLLEIDCYSKRETVRLQDHMLEKSNNCLYYCY